MVVTEITGPRPTQEAYDMLDAALAAAVEGDVVGSETGLDDASTRYLTGPAADVKDERDTVKQELLDSAWTRGTVLDFMDYLDHAKRTAGDGPWGARNLDARREALEALLSNAMDPATTEAVSDSHLSPVVRPVAQVARKVAEVAKSAGEKLKAGLGSGVSWLGDLATWVKWILIAAAVLAVVVVVAHLASWIPRKERRAT